MVNDVIETLAGDRQRALNLLDLLDDHFKAGKLSLNLPPAKRWLPVGGSGLAVAKNCRDKRDSFLFDLVMPVIPCKVESTGLRAALGWSDVVPLGIIMRQIRELASRPAAEAADPLTQICAHLSLRPLDDGDLEALKVGLKGLDWIPTSDGDSLTSIPFAVFKDAPDLPYKKIHSGLLSQRSKQFLTRIGCHPRYVFKTRSNNLTDVEQPN